MKNTVINVVAIVEIKNDNSEGEKFLQRPFPQSVLYSQVPLYACILIMNELSVAVILLALVFEENIEDAIQTRRLHHQLLPDTVSYECMCVHNDIYTETIVLFVCCRCLTRCLSRGHFEVSRRKRSRHRAVQVSISYSGHQS